MTSTDIKLGDPCYLAVHSNNIEGHLPTLAVDGHPGIFADKDEAIRELMDDILTFVEDDEAERLREAGQWSGVVYECRPIQVADLDIARAWAAITGAGNENN